MISFDEGYKLIASLALSPRTEQVAIDDAVGRVLLTPLHAARAQPAQDISAMDGFALAGVADEYELVGEVAAEGVPPKLAPGQAVRIFTGAGVPEGADRILIQENAQTNGTMVRTDDVPPPEKHIRFKGLDFDAGFSLPAPRRISAAEIALIAAMNHPTVEVAVKPRVAIIATGSELIEPGGNPTPQQTIASNAYGIRALVREFGAEADILPIVIDRLDTITEALSATDGYDIVVTTGGASVGKYDFVRQAAEAAGFDIKVHKIALRPGKPVIAGTREGQVFLGLPGNPVSAIIGARMFLRAVIDGQLGLPNELPALRVARLAHDLPENGGRTHFMRAHISRDEGGAIATVEAKQDSALLSILAKTNGLVMRVPHEPAKHRGETISYLVI